MDRIKVEKYNSYKDSEAKWLGNIPSHWITLSNKYIFKLKKNQVGKKSGDYVLLSLTLYGVIKRDMENPQGKFPAEFNTYQEVQKGDFIFCLFDVEETPRCVGLSDFDGMITGAYTVMEPNKSFDRNYLYYFYLNLDSDKRLKPLYTGLRNTISKENFFSFKSFVPPKEEQIAIAQFLERKTALIDQAISIKQKQIELLKERRQIFIHKAVTRGLNPKAKMKDSGVEWIGEIPERWEVKKLKIIASYINRGTTPEYVENSNNKVINQAIFSKGFFDSENIKFTKERSFETDSINKGKVQKNDILLASTGGGVLGKVGFIDFDNDNYFADSHVTIIRGSEPDFFSKYYYFILSINYDLINGVLAQGSTNQTELQRNWLRDFKFPVPTFLEQKDIVEYIEKTNIKTCTAISLKEKEIGKLKEFKSVLINSAVTGKIKVC